MGAMKSKEKEAVLQSPSRPDKKVLYIRHYDRNQFILFDDFSMVSIQGCVYRWYNPRHSKSKELLLEYLHTIKYPGVGLRR